MIFLLKLREFRVTYVFYMKSQRYRNLKWVISEISIVVWHVLKKSFFIRKVKIVLHVVVNKFLFWFPQKFQVVNKFLLAPLCPDKMWARPKVFFVRLIVSIFALSYETFKIVFVPPTSKLYSLYNTRKIITQSNVKLKIIWFHIWHSIQIRTIEYLTNLIHHLKINAIYKLLSFKLTKVNRMIV